MTALASTYRKGQRVQWHGCTYVVSRAHWQRGGWLAVTASADGGPVLRYSTCACPGVPAHQGGTPGPSDRILAAPVAAVDLVTEAEYTLCPGCRGRLV
jgi:hypothetical protein